CSLCFVSIRPPPRSPPFPYTTLFRSGPKPERKSRRKSSGIKITPANIHAYLGVRRFDFGRAEEQAEVGLVTGLAWTEVGGDLLRSEEHTSELQSRENLVCRLLLEKKK